MYQARFAPRSRRSFGSFIDLFASICAGLLVLAFPVVTLLAACAALLLLAASARRTDTAAAQPDA